MKIGLIGNMNNNNFALMRYFRDLGADAHLLLYSNDGQGSSNHFKPECDSWEMEKWGEFIHQTSIPNAPVAALTFPYSWFVSMRSYTRYTFGLQQSHTGSVSVSEIKDAFDAYEALIGSGIAPAVCQRIGRKLDVFYPYSAGVEYLDAGWFNVKINNGSGMYKRIANAVRGAQGRGIRQANFVLNAEVGATEKVLVKIGVKPVRLAIPMLYNLEQIPVDPQHQIIANGLAVINRSKLSIISHSRLMWSRPNSHSEAQWATENKHNDLLLYAFSSLIKLRPDLNPLLILLEYGPDVSATKELCHKLGIDSHVMWLPKMDRKHLIWLIRHVDVGVGQFYDIRNMIWGGTGWEVLACGKPLLQGFNFAEGEFESIFGHPPPPMLPVCAPGDILEHLLYVADHPEKIKQISDGAKDWFNRYNGICLAKRWLDVLMTGKDNENL